MLKRAVEASKATKRVPVAAPASVPAPAIRGRRDAAGCISSIQALAKNQAVANGALSLVTQFGSLKCNTTLAAGPIDDGYAGLVDVLGATCDGFEGKSSGPGASAYGKCINIIAQLDTLILTKIRSVRCLPPHTHHHHYHHHHHHHTHKCKYLVMSVTARHLCCVAPAADVAEDTVVGSKRGRETHAHTERERERESARESERARVRAPSLTSCFCAPLRAVSRRAVWQLRDLSRRPTPSGG